MQCTQWKRDPGPCPVDDTPHTGCVAPTTLTSRTSIDQTVSVAVARPGWLRARTPEPPPPEQTVVEFSTATYKRSEHSSFGKGSRSKRR